jgi:hypothetical protein
MRERNKTEYSVVLQGIRISAMTSILQRNNCEPVGRSPLVSH